MATTIAELLVEIGVEVKDAEKAQKKVDDVRKATTKLGSTAKRETKEAGAAFKRFGATVRRVSERARAGIKKLGAAFSKFKGPILAAGAAATAAAVGVFKFVDSQTAALDSLNKLNAALGTEIEDLQRLTFAASQSGVGQETLSTALKKLNQNLLDIGKGGGKIAGEALEELGLRFEDIQGLEASKQLGLIGDALNGVEDEARRSALSAQIFGQRSGPELATLLKEGTDGIDALGAAAKGVLTQEEIDRATAFQDRLGELTNTVEALTTELAIELLPIVEDVVVAISDWLDENDEIIKQDLPKFIELVSDQFGFLSESLDVVVRATNLVINAWSSLIPEMEGVELGVGNLASEFLRSLNPIFAMVDAVASLIGMMEDLNIVTRQLEGGATTQAVRTARGIERKQARIERLQRREEIKARSVGREISRGRTAVSRFGGAPGRGGGGGGGGGAKRPAKPARAAAAPAVRPEGRTLQDLFQALLTGDQAELSERFKGLDAKTPSVADVKPTVAVTFFNMKITQNITTTDPQEAAAASTRMIRQEIGRANAQAAQALSPQIIR